MQEKLFEGEYHNDVKEPTLFESFDLQNGILTFLARNDFSVFSLFLFTSERKEEGYAFDELMENFVKKGIMERKALERALDILLDIGLLSAKWIFEEEKTICERKFFDNTEVAQYFEEYRYLSFSKLDRSKQKAWTKMTDKLDTFAFNNDFSL